MYTAIAERAAGFVAALVVLASVLPVAMALDFPGPDPGRAVVTIDGDGLRLENDALAVEWKIPDQGAHMAAVLDKRSGAAISTGAAMFVLTLAGDRVVKASELKRVGPPRSEKLAANPQAVCVAQRSAGQQISVTFVGLDSNFEVLWQAVLRDGSNYVRQFVTLKALKEEIPIKNIRLVDLPALGARVAGTVAGSPVVEGTMFFAYEHPNAKNEVVDSQLPGEPNPPMKQIRCSLDRQQPLQLGQPLTQSAVIGVAPGGQLRRAYLYYIERERPRPYTPFLHYNSWYDIAWGDRKMDEKQCLGVIEAFGRELTENRGVALDSFVFDDGWDDNRTLWGFHPGFPRGFAPLDAAAKKYKSHVGVWLSPWGGYGQAKVERLKYGQTQGFETNQNGFSLAGPKYYARFRDACAEMIQQYGVNYFKFDGVGAGNDRAGADAQYLADVEGLLRLCEDLRRLRPEVYLSITTGTWPSPYWLFWGDSTWRNGADCGFHGAGSMRQQWITYRDTYTYRMVVRRGPLYPLNSLMVQGICYAQLGTATKMGNDLKDVVDEIRMLFASGTQLQELYVTPQMMTPPMWDALAEATAWSRENADVLVDVHWLGGDPGAGEPYGYASWSPRKGILALRNPSEKPAEIVVDVKTAFELPDGAPPRYTLQSPWKKAARRPKLTLQAGRPYTFDLAPFEALVFEAKIPSAAEERQARRWPFDSFGPTVLSFLRDPAIRGDLHLSRDQEKGLDAVLAECSKEADRYEKLSKEERAENRTRFEEMRRDFETQAKENLTKEQLVQLARLQLLYLYVDSGPLVELQSERVQTHLQLTDEQERAIDKLHEQWTKECERLIYVTHGRAYFYSGRLEELQQSLEGKASELLTRILTQPQRKKWEAYVLVQATFADGPKVLLRPDAQQILELTDQQRQEIRRIAEEADRLPAEKAGQTTELYRRAHELLTDEQRKRWKAVIDIGWFSTKGNPITSPTDSRE